MKLRNNHYIPDLLVVGGADVVTRDIWANSGAYLDLGLPHVYGPGVNVIGADGDKGKWGSNSNGNVYKITTGTSVGETTPFSKKAPLQTSEETNFLKYVLTLGCFSDGIHCWTRRLLPEAASTWTPASRQLREPTRHESSPQEIVSRVSWSPL